MDVIARCSGTIRDIPNSPRGLPWVQFADLNRVDHFHCMVARQQHQFAKEREEKQGYRLSRCSRRVVLLDEPSFEYLDVDIR